MKSHVFIVVKVICIVKSDANIVIGRFTRQVCGAVMQMTCIDIGRPHFRKY